MVVFFRDPKLAKLCNSYGLMVRALGKPSAARLAVRLAEMEAAEVLSDFAKLPQVKCDPLAGARDGQVGVDLIHPHQLIIQPADEPLPLADDGRADWDEVRTVSVEISTIADND